MLQQAIVQNIFPEVQIPTWQAIARGEAVGNSVSIRYLHQGENVLHYCLFKLEITVLLPTYIKSCDLSCDQAIDSWSGNKIFLLHCSHVIYHMIGQ